MDAGERARARWFRWWDLDWILEEYYWPLIEAGIPEETLLRMPVVRVWERIRTLRSYNGYKNWESWISHEEMMAGSERDDDDAAALRRNEMPGRKRHKHGGKDLRWSEWDIQTAEDYDRYYVPKLGNKGWAKMIGGQ